MASSEELFQHAYRDGLQALELSRVENEVELKTVRADPQAGLTRAVLLEEYDKMVRGVLETLTLPSPDPESVFRGGLKALGRIEELRFLLNNLLEAVKSDDSLQNALTRYQHLGFIDNTSLVDVKDEIRKSPWLSNLGSGSFLRKLWQRLRKTALVVMEIVANAVKVVPKFIALKPKPSIGLQARSQRSICNLTSKQSRLQFMNCFTI